ncbi:hypothetical protein G6O67_003486 [Ophiocordyceps sinensis]|uniref:Uncharacterized protein n=1 Tax=Ophiocordyceps sinensis TaxID=72228 RepID=A0A8H4V8E3_9HYPO|nr:hypothetical protein G6O67_003486 [Ophiocordyceps sinensis]
MTGLRAPCILFELVHRPNMRRDEFNTWGVCMYMVLCNSCSDTGVNEGAWEELDGHKAVLGVCPTVQSRPPTVIHRYTSTGTAVDNRQGHVKHNVPQRRAIDCTTWRPSCACPAAHMQALEATLDLQTT